MEGVTAKRARAGEGSAVDRLSALEDKLLHRVLSFLPAREVVQTMVLSKRWMDLWRYVPVINLDILDFGRTKKKWEKMEHFTYNLLLKRKAPSLDAFRLNMKSVSQDWCRCRHVDTWLRYAIEANPLVLEVAVDLYSDVYHLPCLGSSPCRLKSLHLVRVSLDKSFAERLRSRCPDLEGLVLDHCQLHFSGIQSNTLMDLAVHDCKNSTGDILVIRAPRLVSYCITCNESDSIGVTLDAGTSLARASVDLISDELSPRSEAMVLGSLYNVTSLELYCLQAMAVLDKELGELPIFKKLRTLSLENCFVSTSDVQKVKAVGRFLQKCPNLEKLTFKNFWVQKTIYFVASVVRPVVGPVEFPMLENLRTLFVVECDLYDNFQLLRHFLQKSPNLEKLTVESCEFTKVSAGEKVMTRSKKKHSQFTNLLFFQCPKLESTDIIYKDYDHIPELVSYLLKISGPSPKNAVTLTKV
ncbi:hypothetical protein ACP70R_011643 [Stipagrostis hirtigluma subsp. patula]